MLKTDRTDRKCLHVGKYTSTFPSPTGSTCTTGTARSCTGTTGTSQSLSPGDKTDENGFVVDFGKLKFIKGWIDENLDHACVFSKSDPLWRTLRDAAPEAWKICLVDECSCEGLAKYFFEVFGKMVSEATSGRARVAAVEVSEDKKNTAKYTPDSL